MKTSYNKARRRAYPIRPKRRTDEKPARRIDSIGNSGLDDVRSAHVADRWGGSTVDALALAARALAFCAGTALLSACATRPVIEDVTGVNAPDIAQAVRCEMRDGLKNILADATDSGGEGEKGAAGETKKRRYDLYAQTMRRSHQLKPNVEAEFFQRFFEEMKKGAKAAEGKERVTDEDELQAAVANYASAVIGYEFDLKLRSSTDVEGSVDILSTVTRGAISMAPGAALKRTRRATRTFRLLDSFQGLLTNVTAIRVCAKLRSRTPGERTPDAMYPIRGSLGLEDLFREFLTLNQSANIVGGRDKPNIPVMAEVLLFTTTVTGGIAPTLTLSPIRRGTEFTGAKLSLRTERQDDHQLTLTFAIDERKTPIAIERSDNARQALSELDRQQLRELNDDLRGVREVLRDNAL